MKPKVLVILGPTASGKSGLAIHLAKKYNGEVVSADSRQVYKGLNLGTGKVTKKEMAGVKHHLLDVADPKKKFTVVDFKDNAQKAITKIHARGRLPILCGGTGFYIQAVIDNLIFPDVPPNSALRLKLGKLSTEKVFGKLVKLDPAYAKKVDKNNKVKIIRAIEIAETLGEVPKLTTKNIYKTLQIGIKTPDDVLKQKISKRLLERLKKGMIREVANLHKQGLSWKRMNELGLEYRNIALYLQKKLSRKEMIQKLNTEIWHYARRQKTWFRRDTRITWYSLNEKKKIEQEVKTFIGR